MSPRAAQGRQREGSAREPREIFDALGALPWSDRARKELWASGETSRRPMERVWEALPPQELYIAQLAAQGRRTGRLE
jgi:hypothetical protein